MDGDNEAEVEGDCRCSSAHVGSTEPANAIFSIFYGIPLSQVHATAFKVLLVFRTCRLVPPIPIMDWTTVIIADDSQLIRYEMESASLSFLSSSISQMTVKQSSFSDLLWAAPQPDDPQKQDVLGEVKYPVESNVSMAYGSTRGLQAMGPSKRAGGRGAGMF